MPSISPEDARIFRIVHVANLPWILRNGLHCRNATQTDPNYVNIGNRDLIDMRAKRPVEVGPGGTLADYVPFYFTPYSIMMLNIRTGYHGIPQRSNDEIAILVSSIPRLVELRIPFVFTNQHAYPRLAEYYTDPADLNRVDWELLQSRDFQHDPEDPGKKERYQAEALVHRHLPTKGLLGICCHSAQVKSTLERQIADTGIDLAVATTPRWYF